MQVTSCRLSESLVAVFAGWRRAEYSRTAVSKHKNQMKSSTSISTLQMLSIKSSWRYIGYTYHQSLLWFTASFDLTVLYSHWCSACKREINSIVYSLELQVCYTNPTNCYSTKPKFWSSLNYCVEFGPGHWWRSSFSPVPMEIFPRGAIIPL